jgi:hypothetical protein
MLHHMSFPAADPYRVGRVLAELTGGQCEVDVGSAEPPLACSGFHVALSVPVSRERIEEVGAREGWLVRACDRGPFQLMELWVENRFMIELLTSAMTAAYLDFMKPEAYGAWLEDVRRSGAELHASR